MSSNSGENAVSSSRLFASIYMSARNEATPENPVKVTYCLRHRQPEVNGVCRVCTHYRERGVNDSHNEREAAKTELPVRNAEAERRGKRAMAIILLVAALTVIIILLASALIEKRKTGKTRPSATAVETNFKV